MNQTFLWSARFNHPAKGASVVVREALLPALLLPSVPVMKQVEEQFTVIDRFVLEAAVRMTHVTADVITEITGVPTDAVDRIAGRLVGFKMLVRDDRSGYRPSAQAATLLASETSLLTKQRLSRLTFLYLPEGDDLIAYQDGTHREEPPMFHQIPPRAEPGPLNPLSTRRNMAEFLRLRITSGKVARLPEGIVDVIDDGREIPIACPVYECAGGVVESSSGVELRLYSTSARKGRVHYRIAGAEGQAAVWSTRAGWSDDAVAGWTGNGGTVTAIQTGQTSWSLTVDGLAAKGAAAAKVDLSNPAGLTVLHGDTFSTYIDVSFTPADHVAQKEFAMQDALLRITSTAADDLTDEALAEAVSAARAAYGLSDDDLTDEVVRDRLWSNGHFLHVYALRKDFVGYG